MRTSALGGGKSGPHFTDPWLLGPPITVANGSLLAYEGATERLATVTAYWTMFNYQGTAANTDYTADAWKNIVNITGKGLMGGAVGPVAGGAETTTFGITRDGLPEVEIPVLLASGQRAVLAGSGNAAIYNSNTALAQGDMLQLNAGKTILSAPTSAFVMAWNVRRLLNLSSLRFDVSLLVRIKHSANVTGTANNERQSGVIHMNGL